MKKIISLLIVICLIIFSTTLFAASVTPTEYPGNDANPNQYTPPAGSVRVTLPGSDAVGTFVYKFNEFGQFDSAGTNVFTLTVGIAPGTSYTQVLSWSWSGSSSLFAVIVKGGPAFNLYEYNGETSDTNLVAPTNPSGNPADISHVSIIIFPEVPPTPPDGVVSINICCILFLIILFSIILPIISKCNNDHD